MLSDVLISTEFSGRCSAPTRWLRTLESHRCEESPGKPADARLLMDLQGGWADPDSIPKVECVSDPDSGRREIGISHASLVGMLVDQSGTYTGEFRAIGAAGADAHWEIAMRTTLSFLCEDRGQLLLHASGVLREAGAWLFIGPSGSGKTTIATELRGGGVPFSIDRCIIAFDATGKPIAHSTPFSDGACTLDRRRSAPVAGVCFIEQAPDHSVSSMTAFEAIREILGQTLTFSRDRERLERTMKAVGMLAESGLCFRMRFAKNDGFWPLLERARGRGV